MLTSYNVGGINKVDKLREIFSRLNDLQPEISILLETRVKQPKAITISDKMKHYDSFVDNYQHHVNGRI